MICNRCPFEDSCAELKAKYGVPEASCPLELVISFILVVAKSFGQKK